MLLNKSIVERHINKLNDELFAAKERIKELEKELGIEQDKVKQLTNIMVGDDDE